MAIIIHESLVVLVDENEDIPELNLDFESPMDWSEGADQFRDKSEDELWNMLGLSTTKRIPFFNEWFDTEGIRNPHADPAWFAEDQDTKELLAPRWHQLVGAMEMLTAAFEGHSMLLMDEVGMGKTMQMVIVFAVLEYFREYYKKHGQFPGSFSK